MRRAYFAGPLIAAVIGLAAVPAGAAGQATRGTFGPLDIPDLDVGGHATMVRTADGRTKASVRVEGLEPGATYLSHVHNQACDDGRGGGHYQDQPGGAATPPNELWLSSEPHDPLAGITANSAGVATGHGWAPWTARPEARSVVVHQTGDPAIRIACADLA
jgi:hypothetical protein